MNQLADDPREKNNEKYTAVFPGAVYCSRPRERREKSRDDPRTTGERCRAAGSS